MVLVSLSNIGQSTILSATSNPLKLRKIRHLVDTGLTLLAHGNVPLWFWSYAFATACFLINRMPSPVLHNASSHEKLFKNTPNHGFLKTSGCIVYPLLRPYNTHKFAYRSKLVFSYAIPLTILIICVLIRIQTRFTPADMSSLMRVPLCMNHKVV